MINKPILRFPDFTNEWAMVSLNSISSQVARISDEGDYPVLTISAGNGFLEQKDRFSQVIAGNSLSKYTLLFKDELAYNRGNSKKFKYGCIYRLNDYDRALVPNVYISFRIEDGIPKFYEYLFQKKYLDRQLRQLISSSARMDGLLNISKSDFFNVKVPVTNKLEQKKIASFFSLIDKKIEIQTEKVEELKNYKKGIMQKIFSQELRFKDEDGNEYPEWEKRRLQTIVEKKIKGKNPLYSETGNVLLNNEFMENNTEPLFVENEIDVTKKDILILWDGSQAGKVYTGFEGVLGSTFVAITLNKNNCNIFIQEQLEYNLNKIQRAWREGSGVPHVAKDFIENYKIFVPCYEEQSKISKMLLNINEKIKLEEKKLQYIKELKKGLLQQMFI